MKLSQDDFADNIESTDIQTEVDIDVLSHYYSQLSAMIEDRLHEETFQEVLDYVCNFGEHKVAYITLEEEERQLRFCAKWKFTFSQIRDEMEFYRDRAERAFKIWWANRSKETRTKILLQHKEEIGAKLRTKGNYGEITKDEIRDTIISTYPVEWQQWQDYIDRLNKGSKMMDNLADDIKHRSIILMNLGNRGMNY